MNVLFAQQIIDDVDQNEEFEGAEKGSLYISGAVEARNGAATRWRTAYQTKHANNKRET